MSVQSFLMRRVAAFLLGAAVAMLSVYTVRAGAQELLLPVPSVTLYPNDEIGEEHVIDRAFIASTVTRGSVQEDRRTIVGKVARRTLIKGQPIPVNALREPYVVLSGKPAVVIYEEGGLTITGQATALQSGSIGDVVSLRNAESGTMIRGIVSKDGTVRVGNK